MTDTQKIHLIYQDSKLHRKFVALTKDQKEFVLSNFDNSFKNLEKIIKKSKKVKRGN